MITKRIIIFIGLIFCGLIVKSQQISINDYIAKRIKKLGALNDSEFFDGFVIKNNDTLPCRIYLKKGKVSNDSYSFVITKLTNDSLVTYSTDQIEGYVVKGEYFRQFKTKTEIAFIRLVQRGRINLYDKASTPNNPEFTYFLLTPDNKIYSIEPFSENIFDEYRLEGHVANNQQNLFNTKTKKLDEKFKYCFSIILSDCPKVVNLVKSGYYGINDIESIIETYNKCKD